MSILRVVSTEISCSFIVAGIIVIIESIQLSPLTGGVLLIGAGISWLGDDISKIKEEKQ